MKRRALPVAAALASTAVLLLTACGTEGGKNAGADVGGGSPETPLSPSPSRDGDHPDLSLPGDVKEAFEEWKTGDVTNDTALKEVQTFVDHDATITGAIRYYSPTVSLSGNKTAAVTLCADESKAFNKLLKMNKVDRNATRTCTTSTA
ncbi:hypothetical protein ACFYXF_24510 [Streptomyces sp. NPDC002680]|uniref:hypothetical protein n=1 Tax=Streptomyces sp. NPDC002680 TaxID=3364659 RepID=UPI00367DFECB